MLEFEFGRVKFFDDRDGKRFGFLVVLRDGRPTEEEVFFHFGDGQFVEINEAGDDIIFIGRRFGDSQMPMWVPQVGDPIAFQRTTGAGDRPKASPWTYGEAYLNRVNLLLAPYHRVLKEIGTGDNGEPPPVEPIWMGKGAEQLSAVYPVRVLGGTLVDPLAPSTEDGVPIRYTFWQWFATEEEDTPRGAALGRNGIWREVADPRYRPDYPAAKI